MKYSLEITVKFMDDGGQYHHKRLLLTDDIFECQAACDIIERNFDYISKEKIKAEGKVLQRRATEHQHPNWPCEYLKKKKKWSCGEVDVVNRNTIMEMNQ